MFKKLLLTIGVTLLSSFALADDFDSNQFNFKVKTDEMGIEVRTYTNSSRDHIQLEKYVGDWEFAYRYDEQTTKTEHRPRITYKLLENEFVYIKPRVEYRYFEGSTDDYFRVRSQFGVKLGSAYVEITPMLHYGQGVSDDMSIDEYQSKVGYNFDIAQNAKLNMFVQHEADKDFNKTDMFLGTTLEFKF